MKDKNISFEDNQNGTAISMNMWNFRWKFVKEASEDGIILKECTQLLELLQNGNLTPADQASIFLLLVETEVRYRAKEEIYISERKHECEKIVFFSVRVWAANSQLRDFSAN